MHTLYILTCNFYIEVSWTYMQRFTYNLNLTSSYFIFDFIWIIWYSVSNYVLLSLWNQPQTLLNPIIFLWTLYAVCCYINWAINHYWTLFLCCPIGHPDIEGQNWKSVLLNLYHCCAIILTDINRAQKAPRETLVVS